MGNKRAAPEGESKEQRTAQAVREHSAALDGSTQWINETIAELVQHDTPANVAMLFRNRAAYSTIRRWRNGWRPMAPWAIDMLKAKARKVTAAIDRIEPGPGQSAGWRNLSGYMANR